MSVSPEALACNMYHVLGEVRFEVGGTLPPRAILSQCPRTRSSSDQHRSSTIQGLSNRLRGCIEVGPPHLELNLKVNTPPANKQWSEEEPKSDPSL